MCCFAPWLTGQGCVKTSQVAKRLQSYTMDTQRYIFYSKTNIPVFVRHIEPDDALFLVEIFANMGSESRYRRFLQPLDDPDPERVWLEAERISHTAAEEGGGLIAFVDLVDFPNSPIAAARYVKLDEKTAEIALSVRDDWQQVGVGKQLLRLLMCEAYEMGLTKLVGTMQNRNDAMWHILKQMPFPVSRTPDGVVSEIEVVLR